MLSLTQPGFPLVNSTAVGEIYMDRRHTMHSLSPWSHLWKAHHSVCCVNVWINMPEDDNFNGYPVRYVRLTRTQIVLYLLRCYWADDKVVVDNRERRVSLGNSNYFHSSSPLRPLHSHLSTQWHRTFKWELSFFLYWLL